MTRRMTWAMIATALTVIVSGGLLSLANPAVAEDATTAEQTLAEQYAPVIMLKAQEHPCDADGEPYAPTDVDVVLDNPDVLLRQVGAQNPVITAAPAAEDLFGRGEGFYLDFPGSAVSPGCIYERDFDRYSETTTGARSAVVYAHVARQEDRPGQLALQYWFYWYYNDWNNKHESDWEGIQLLFDAATVEEALDQEPVSVGYAQHEGGERAAWDSDKLARDGDRPVVYPSAGSHASYYGSALYIGRSASEGFGCDTTDGPSVRTDPTVVVLPDSVSSPDDPLAWLDFEGRWGERLTGPFNGPTGPVDKDRWTHPIDWQDDLRAASVVVPTGDSQATSVVNAFCDVVEWGSGQLITLGTSPLRLLVALVVVVMIARWLIRQTVWNRVDDLPLVFRRRAGEIIRAAATAYRHRARVLIALGFVYVPTALAVGVLTGLLAQVPLVDRVLALGGRASETSLLFALLAGSIANLISYVLVNAMVAAHFEDLSAGGDPTARDAVRSVWRRMPELLIGLARSIVIVGVLVISVVGIPWGIRQFIRYQFLPQAVMLEDVDGRAGLARSSRLVSGRWWHTAVMITIFNLLVAASGLVVGLLLLVVAAALPMWVLSALITLVYALIVPLAAVAQTLLYGDAVAESDEHRTEERARESVR